MKLEVQPLVALCDEKVNIRITGLPASANVKVSAAMSFPWAKHVKYESVAWFTADSNGNPDLAKQKPDSGSYDFVDSMGLIVSLKQTSGDLKDIAQGISVNENLFIDITVECGNEKESARLERLFKSPEIKCLRITDEFVGELYYAENSDNQLIIFIGGSGSGLGVNSLIAAGLASHGFTVLSLPFFSEKGLPAHLSAIPLEYFEKVFARPSNNPITKGKGIQIIGMSKGGEAAALLASRYPFIKKVALRASHAYCFQGIAFKNESSRTYEGKQLPYIRMKNLWVLEDMISCMIRNEPFGFTHTFRKSLAVARNKDEACIKIENSRADLLMFTTTECNMWNTYDGGKEIMDTLKKNNYRHKYDLNVYEDAGEQYYMPYVIPATESSMKMAPRLVPSTGGNVKGNAYAQRDTWEKTIQFLKN
jgi:esterase/lipase